LSKKLQVQKQQSNISNFKVRIIQRSVVLVRVAKKGQVMKMFTSARGQCTNIKSPPQIKYDKTDSNKTTQTQK